MKMDPAGHGGASGRYDRLHDQAFEYAWMLSQVGSRSSATAITDHEIRSGNLTGACDTRHSRKLLVVRLFSDLPGDQSEVWDLAMGSRLVSANLPRNAQIETDPAKHVPGTLPIMAILFGDCSQLPRASDAPPLPS
jgi:hypothetical protein